MPTPITLARDSDGNEVDAGTLGAQEAKMSQKFDPAPFDKHAANPKKAIKVDLVIDEQLKDGIVGGSFPASDPPSATQPSPSKYDQYNE